jgi:hypothetical protein
MGRGGPAAGVEIELGSDPAGADFGQLLEAPPRAAQDRVR